MPLSKKRPIKAFLDSSVIIAAVLSPAGGSFRIFQEAQLGKIKLYISPFIFTEVVMALEKKYPTKLSSFYELFTKTPLNSVKDPSSKLVANWINLINPEDAPILAAAVKLKPDFLITWDIRHFLKKEVVSKASFIICTPKEFFQKYWKSH